MQTFLGNFPGTPEQPDPPLRIRDVIAETGLKKSAIYAKMRTGDFPLATMMRESTAKEWHLARAKLIAEYQRQQREQQKATQ